MHHLTGIHIHSHTTPRDLGYKYTILPERISTPSSILVKMARSSRQRTRHSARRASDTVPLLSQVPKNQPSRETKPVRHNGCRQKQATLHCRSSQAPCKDRTLLRLRLRSGPSMMSIPLSQSWGHDSESEALDHEQSMAAHRREHVRLDWMRRLRRKPHRQ